MSARDRAGLETALRGLGLRCAVEEWDALAVAIPEPGERGLENADVRQRAIALARQYGFSHLALELRDGRAELRDDPSRAPFPRD